MRRLAVAMVLASCGARTELRGAPVVSDAGADLTPDFVWYKLDETSGSTAHDSSSHHWDMTNLDGVTWSDGARFGGASACGSTTVDAGVRAPPLTMTAWLTPDPRADETTTAWGLSPFPPDALSGDAPSLGGYGIGLDVWTDGGGGDAIALETGAGPAIAYHVEPVPFAAGTRHFVVLVVTTDGQAALYTDGALAAQFDEDVPPSLAPAPLHLGCHNDDGGYGTKRFFEGRIRDARIYKRALGQDDIARLYQIGPA